MKKILVVCGAGLITATLICKDIETILSHQKIEAQIISCKAKQAERMMSSVDVVVTSLHLEHDPGKPTIVLQSLFGEEYQLQLEKNLLALLIN